MQTHNIRGRPTEVVPVPEPVVGVRLFGINYNKLLLTSLAQRVNDFWLPGEIKQSVCGRAPEHGVVPPAADCTCGIWSCKSRTGLNKSFSDMLAFQATSVDNPWYGYTPRYHAMICARIEQWGIIIKHEWGYRSEYARIIPESICWWPRANGRTQSKLLNYIRERYARQT